MYCPYCGTQHNGRCAMAQSVGYTSDGVRLELIEQLAQDAETKHDPKNGQFTGSSASTPEQHNAAVKEHTDSAEAHNAIGRGRSSSLHEAARHDHKVAVGLHQKAATNADFRTHAQGATKAAAKSSSRAFTEEPNGPPKVIPQLK